MTSTDETTPTPEGAPTRRRPIRWPLIAAAVIAIAVAAGIAIALAGDDDPDTPATADSAQLTALQQGCQDWMNDRGPLAGSDTTWCSNMTGWMQDQMRDGQMMGTMMWGNPERMLDTCTQWMATGPAAVADGTNPEAWCRDMVTWMDQHTNDWDDWMHG
jgi:hypothetical protein